MLGDILVLEGQYRLNIALGASAISSLGTDYVKV